MLFQRSSALQSNMIQYDSIPFIFLHATEMRIPAITKAKLRERSNRCCAFRGCTQTLLVQYGDQEEDIGTAAHIIAQSENGPRGDASADIERNAIGNLLYLCPTHHIIVDLFPQEFTCDILHEMKRAHEYNVARVAERANIEISHLTSLEQEILSKDEMHHYFVYAKRYGDALLCIYNCSRMSIMGNGEWRGAGFAFKLLNPGKQMLCLAEYSEAALDIRFQLFNDGLIICEETLDYEHHDFVPFLMRKFVLFPHINSERYVRLLKAPERQVRTAEAIFQEFSEYCKAMGNSDHGDPERLLFRFRDEGLSNPDPVLQAFEKIEKGGLVDGAVGETLSDLQSEVIRYKKADPQ